MLSLFCVLSGDSYFGLLIKGVKMKKGFTLIELLVVIAIIALLLAIIMPALGSVKEVALRLICRNNVRQQVIGTTLYSEENNSYVPNIVSSGTWFWDISFWSTKQIAHYGGFENEIGVFACPGNKEKKEGDARWWQFSWVMTGSSPAGPIANIQTKIGVMDESVLSDSQMKSYYRVGAYLYMFDRYDDRGDSSLPEVLDSGEKAKWIRKLVDVKSPGSTTMIADSVISEGYNNTNGGSNFFEMKTLQGLWELNVLDASNHKGRQSDADGDGKVPAGSNIGYADGHADWRGFDEMEMRYNKGHYFYW